MTVLQSVHRVHYKLSRMNALPRLLWLPLRCDLIRNDASDVHVVPNAACRQMQCTLGSMALSLINHRQDGLMPNRPILHRYLHYRQHGEIHTERAPSLDCQEPHEPSGADWRAHVQGRSVLFDRICHHAQGTRSCEESQISPFPFMAPLGPRSIEVESGLQGLVYKGFALCRSTDRALKQLNRKDESLQGPSAGSPFINSTISSCPNPFIEWRCCPKYEMTTLYDL